MKMIPRCLLALSAALPISAEAHKAWLLPSSTTLAPGQWVTVDAAVSNDIFNFNHVALRLDHLQLTAPDGASLPAQNPATGRYRSVFDVELSQSGTYRFAVLNQGLFASWTENGETKRWRGSVEAYASAVPAQAEALQVSESSGRIETFVTAGQPSVLAPVTQGLALQPMTHPNDLFVGETASFVLLLDGEPLAGQPLTVIPAGIRYRDAQNEIRLSTDADGKFSIEWPAAGLYWLESSLQDGKTRLPQAKQRRLSYAATLEVLAP